MVMSVMGSPPQRTVLRSTRPKPGEYELEKTSGLVSAMGKVAVIPGGDADHPNKV
jgi:hypothetical protein